MKIVNLVQGTEAWHQFRLTHNGASEAAAMLGLSKKVKRNDLVRMKATGIAKVFSDWVQENLLSRGHEVEAAARPIVEADIQDDLYPVTCEEGRESASCDGLTLGGELAFEHKLWNVELAESVRQGVVPEEHMPQCQQILMVTGAEKLRFVVSDGTALNMVHVDVLPDAAWFDRLRDGWRQFDKDVAAYVPQDEAEPAAIGRAPETLPALRIEVTGAVTASNLAEFKQTALHAIRSVNRDLNTDADFADAAKAVKWCEDVESRTKAAKEHALSQTADIDALFKTLDDICAEARDVRLDLGKLVERRKVEKREQAVVAARRALEQHVAELQAELAPMRIQPVAADFAAAIKGLRSIASMQDALDTTLANGKIAADAQARGIRANLATFKAQAAGFEFLFSDLGAIVHKAADDFGVLVTARVDKHKADEAKREEEQRARIRQEEAARLEREQKDAEAKRQREAETQALAEEAEARAVVERAQALQAQELRRNGKERVDEPAEAIAAAPAPAPAPEVVPLRGTAAPSMRLGEIQAAIAPLSITAEGLAQLGFPAHVERGLKLYPRLSLPLICKAMREHLLTVANAQRQAA